MFSNCVLFRCAHLDAESEIGIWLGQRTPCWDIGLLLHFGCQKRSSLIRIMIWSHESKLLGASTFITLLHETKGAKIVILQRTRTGNMTWKGLFLLNRMVGRATRSRCFLKMWIQSELLRNIFTRWSSVPSYLATGSAHRWSSQSGCWGKKLAENFFIGLSSFEPWWPGNWLNSWMLLAILINSRRQFISSLPPWGWTSSRGSWATTTWSGAEWQSRRTCSMLGWRSSLVLISSLRNF